LHGWERTSNDNDEEVRDDGEGSSGFAIWIPTELSHQPSSSSSSLPPSFPQGGASGGGVSASKSRMPRSKSSPRLLDNYVAGGVARRPRKRFKSKSLPGPGVSWRDAGSGRGSNGLSSFFLYPVDEDRQVLPPTTQPLKKKAISSTF
jgi:hypothetical protein